MLRRSNLGGLGGRCGPQPWRCADGAPDESTPRDILIHDLGKMTSGSGETVIDLRISNESEYRAWNLNLNGIQIKKEGGRFGVVNLVTAASQRRSGLAGCGAGRLVGCMACGFPR